MRRRGPQRNTVMLLFSLDTDSTLARGIADGLGVPLAALEDRRFEDGEHKYRPLVDPRGVDVCVIGSLHGDAHASPHDKLFRLLVFAATLRDHGAARVSAVVPYLAYARKDRRTKPFDPLTLRYVAQMVEALGVARLMVLEVHNPAAFENAFRCATSHVQAHQAFDVFIQGHVGAGALAVASPDPGGVKRAQLWRESLEQSLARPVGFAMVDKRRSAGIVSSASLVAGDVAGATVLLLDDLIASGGTMRNAALALRAAGARSVVACAAHGLFTGDAGTVLADPAIDLLLVTDSVPTFRLAPDAPVRAKLRVQTAAGSFVHAIRAWGAAGAAHGAQA